MGLNLVTPPSTRVVTLDEAKRQVRVHTAETRFDAELTAYIDAATSHLDGPNGILERALEPQTWELTLDAFTDTIELPLRPVISVASIKYSDADGVEQTVDPNLYTVDLSSPAWIVLNSSESWPETISAVNAVRVRFVAGYARAGSESGVPAALKQAILLLVGHWFSNKSAVTIGQTVASTPLAFDALVMPYRRLAIA